MPIEDWITDPIAAERHEAIVPAPPERAVRLMLEMPADGDPVVRRLIKMRGMRHGGTGAPSDGTMLSFFRANGFLLLQDESREVIVGIGAPAAIFSDERIAHPSHWLAWDRPGWFKAALSFRAEPADEGRSRFITETQAQATDHSARRWFRLYWLGIGPFSRLIRRRWLRQLVKLAEEEHAVGGEPAR